MQKIWLVNCKTVQYDLALKWQKHIVLQKQKKQLPDLFLFLEHPPVITIGKHGDAGNILYSIEGLKKKGITIYPISRGGDVTFHGPGQLVGYPIVNLKNFQRSIRLFVSNLEDLFITMLKNYYSLEAQRIKDYTGVWIKQNKITAMGLSVHRSITMHGFAFNVTTDLNYFKLITPCGISDKGVTSLEKNTSQKVSVTSCMRQLANTIPTVFDKNCEWHSLQEVFSTFYFPSKGASYDT